MTAVDWTSQRVDLGSNRGCESSILIDGNDHVYIAYQECSASKLKRLPRTRTGNGTNTPSLRKPSKRHLPRLLLTSMAVDAQGQFHIAHFEEQDDDLRYSTGAPWWVVHHYGRRCLGAHWPQSSIAVDAADRPSHRLPHVERSELEVCHTRLTRSTGWRSRKQRRWWERETFIFIDSSGVIHIACSTMQQPVTRVCLEIYRAEYCY